MQIDRMRLWFAAKRCNRKKMKWWNDKKRVKIKKEFVMMRDLTKMFQIKKSEKYAFKISQHDNEKINWRNICVVEKRREFFTILSIYIMFTRCWWLRCKQCNNCSNWRTLMIDKMRYSRFSLWERELSIDWIYRL